jgi:hypothetical protein
VFFQLGTPRIILRPQHEPIAYPLRSSLFSLPSLPSLPSCSFSCYSLPNRVPGYVQRANQEFAKVGLLGVTMLSASGDSGTRFVFLFVFVLVPVFVFAFVCFLGVWKESIGIGSKTGPISANMNSNSPRAHEYKSKRKSSDCQHRASTVFSRKRRIIRFSTPYHPLYFPALAL